MDWKNKKHFKPIIYLYGNKMNKQNEQTFCVYKMGIWEMHRKTKEGKKHRGEN